VFWTALGAALLLIGGGVPAAQAQAEERPIYLYTGEGQQKDFTWTDPEGATAYVFREPIPEGEEGRMISEAEAKTKRGWPSQDQIVGRTSLVESEDSPFGSGALRTEDSFPNEKNGIRQRYLLLVEAGGDTYCSRTLTNRSGNSPRYHLLTDPTVVRVGKAHSLWQEQAERLIARAEQWANGGDTSPSQGKVSSASASSRAEKANRQSSSAPVENGVGVGLSLADRFSVLGKILLFVVLTIVLGTVLIRGIGWYLDARRDEKSEVPPHMKEDASDEAEASTARSDSSRHDEEEDRSEEEVEIRNPTAAEGLRNTTSRIEEGDPEAASSSVENLFMGSEETADGEEGPSGEAYETDAETENDGESDSEPSISLQEIQIRGRFGTAFVTWCQEEDDLRSVGSRFEWFLMNRFSLPVSVSHWTVQEEGEYARATPSDATHWIAETKKATVLFPLPKEESFASTEGYENVEPPDQVAEAIPTLVAVEEDTLSIREAGHLK